MSLFNKNFVASFKANGGHCGPETLKALEPMILACKTTGMTGAQTGLALSFQAKTHRELVMVKQEAQYRAKPEFTSKKEFNSAN